MALKRELKGRIEATLNRGYLLVDPPASVKKIVSCGTILRIILKYFVKICNL